MLYALFIKISNGDTSYVQSLFDKSNIDPNIILNNFNWTPLHIAAYKGHKELV